MKYRALRIDAGNFAWGSENCTKKVRVLDVVYNATSNELVRTKTLTKNSIVQIDAQPYKQWYLKKYGVDLGKKGKKRWQGRQGGQQGGRGTGEEEPPCDLQAQSPGGQAEARPGSRGAVPKRPVVGGRFFQAWAVWPLRRLRLGRRRAYLLQEEA